MHEWLSNCDKWNANTAHNTLPLMRWISDGSVSHTSSPFCCPFAVITWMQATNAIISIGTEAVCRSRFNRINEIPLMCPMSGASSCHIAAMLVNLHLIMHHAHDKYRFVSYFFLRFSIYLLSIFMPLEFRNALWAWSRCVLMLVWEDMQCSMWLL